MNQSAAERKTLEILAEEFVLRYRNGQRPALSEYIRAHPELADEIRELFPTLVVIEELAPSDSESSFSQPAASLQQAPLSLGDYRLLREIGRGGMGVVYEAEQLSLGRRVALKVLPRHAAGEGTARQRFFREARAAAQLHHTNIVPVHEVGENAEACWYAMQLILGQGLDQIIEELRQLYQAASEGRLTRQWAATRTDLPERPPLSQVTQALREGQFACPDLDASTTPTSLASAPTIPLPSRSELSAMDSAGDQYHRSVARIGRQAAEGLAYAHARGVIHRDVKPSNLLLDMAGVVWITDFGLAKTRDTSLTTTGDILGTFRYMAPERFQGEGDERADVYGLGLTLYELLVLRPAFAEPDRLRLIDQIKTAEPPRPRTLDPRIPRDLETILLKAIDKEAKRRYPSAEALAEDLRRYLANEPIKARRTSSLERVRLWGRRNPAVASLLGVVFLLLICLTAGSMIAAFRLKEERNALAAAEEDRTAKLYQSLVAQANSSRFSRQVGQRFATLEAVREAAGLVRERHMPAERLDELRNLAIAALALPDMRTLRTWEGFPAGVQWWDADDRLRRYARVDLDGSILLHEIDTNAEIARLKVDGWRSDIVPHFNPGGRFLCVRCNNQFRVWNVAEGQPILVKEGEHHGFAFYPDGRRLLVQARDGSLSVHDLENPQAQPVSLSRAQPPASVLAFDPSANRLAAIVSGKVQIRDAQTGKTLSTLDESSAADFAAWHPSGDYLALVCNRHDIHVWDLKRSRRASILKGCRNSGIFLAFTPEGERLLSDGWENVLRMWDWRTGRQVLQQTGSSNLKCRADGRLLIRAEKLLNLVELNVGREYRTIVQQSNVGEDVTNWHIDCHPQGRLLIVSMSDGTRLFELETGEELGKLPQGGFSSVFQGKQAILTNCVEGLFRWPIQTDPLNANRLRVGPPKRLHSGTVVDMDCARDVEVIGQAAHGGAYVVRPGKEIRFLGPHADARHIAVSPDGKYAVTGNHASDEGVKVWHTESGRMLAHFPVGSATYGAFSPNGEWLSVGGSRGCLMVRVGTWEERPVEAHGIFSPDSCVLAARASPGVIQLLEAATGRELARLVDPNQDSPGIFRFTPEGGKLLDSSDDGRCIHVWDLRAIRSQLADLGLDWEQPPLPPAPPLSPEPLQVRIDLGDFARLVEAATLVQQAGRLERANKHNDALAQLRKAVRIAPSLTDAHNNLAWLLATGPKELRDPEQALKEARQAIEQEPEQAMYLNTLGVALYRAGQFAEAVPVLERSLREGRGQSDAFDLFFQAMCHHRLGDAAKAKECRDRAATWFQKHKGQLTTPGWVRELTEFQAEADAVLKEPPGQAKK